MKQWYRSKSWDEQNSSFKSHPCVACWWLKIACWLLRVPCWLLRVACTVTPLFTWNGLILVYILDGQGRPHSTMERATERTSATRMHICEVCNKSFTRKDNLSRHLSVHGEKSFQCSHCSKCYSQQVKLKVHTFHHHTNEKQKLSNKLLSCGYCSKIFGQSFNFRRHMTVCKKKSVEPTTPDMNEMMLEMTNAERQYRHNLEVGEPVSTLLNSNENVSEESLTDKYKKALKLYRESQVRHVPAYEHATLKP